MQTYATVSVLFLYVIIKDEFRSDDVLEGNKITFFSGVAGHVRQFVLIATFTSLPLFSGVNNETMAFRILLQRILLFYRSPVQTPCNFIWF